MNGIRFKDLVSLEKSQSTKWFLGMFYVMAAVPLALIIEGFLKNSTAATAASAVVILSIMAAAVCYSRAMFKSFHYSIYHDTQHGDGLQNISHIRLVLFKLLVAVSWLLALALVAVIVFFVHSNLLKRMPQDVMETELVQLGISFISENFGQGIYLMFSALSLFFQAMVLISITYVTATVSHLKFCSSYKPLAGLFAFVLLYFFENDFAVVLKRILMRGQGGIEELLSHDLKNAMGVITGIEIFVYVIITLGNVAITCYFLKKTRRGEVEWKK